LRLSGHICIRLLNRRNTIETPRVVFITVQNDKFSATVRTCSVTDYGSIECKILCLMSVLLALIIQLMPATKHDLENF